MAFLTDLTSEVPRPLIVHTQLFFVLSDCLWPLGSNVMLEVPVDLLWSTLDCFRSQTSWCEVPASWSAGPQWTVSDLKMDQHLPVLVQSEALVILLVHTELFQTGAFSRPPQPPAMGPHRDTNFLPSINFLSFQRGKSAKSKEDTIRNILHYVTHPLQQMERKIWFNILRFSNGEKGEPFSFMVDPTILVAKNLHKWVNIC